MLLDRIKLEDGEEILVQTRRHWFVITVQLLSFAFAALLPPILLSIALKTVGTSTFITASSLPAAVETYTLPFVYTLWLLGLWITSFNVWTNYYLDILTVTDRRLILINQKGLFRRNTASFRLERLQDINVEVHGLIATLLDFGTIHIETAGHSEEDFVAKNIPHPRDIKSTILAASDERLSEMKPDSSH